MGGNDRLEGWGLSMSNHEGIEAAPGYAVHADVAIGPFHLGELRDDLDGIGELRIGILPVRQRALASSRAPHIHSCDDVATFSEVRAILIISQVKDVVLTVREHLQDDRKSLASSLGGGFVVGHCQFHSVGHLEHALLDRERVIRR